MYDDDYYEDEDYYGDPIEDPYEQQLGAVLDHLHAREQHRQHRQQAAAEQRAAQEFESLRDKYPQLRDEKFVAEVARRGQALASAAGDPEQIVNPTLVEELTKTVIAEQTAHPASEWWGEVAAAQTDPWGDDTGKDERRAEAVAKAETDRREGNWNPDPAEPQSAEEWWDQLETGDPLAEPAKPDPVVESNRELAAELRALRSGEPAPDAEPSESD